MATWDDWISAYGTAYEAVPDNPHLPCPNCSHDALRLVFTGNIEQSVGWAAFWCDNCLQGITVSRTSIPPGAVVRSITDAPEERLPRIPNYQIVA